MGLVLWDHTGYMHLPDVCMWNKFKVVDSASLDLNLASFSWRHMQKEEISQTGEEANLNLCVLPLDTYYSSHPHTHIHTCIFDAPKQNIYGIALSPGNCLFILSSQAITVGRLFMTCRMARTCNIKHFYHILYTRNKLGVQLVQYVISSICNID